MTLNWQNIRLGDIGSFKYGSLPKRHLVGMGPYPIFTGYCYQESYPQANCLNGDLIVVARGVGGTGDVKIVSQDCFLTNLSILMNLDNSVIYNKYIFYLFKYENLRYLDSGSAQSQITIKDLENVFILVPPLPEQRAIASVLSSLDDKIDLLHRQNSTLEAMAEALFKQWFVVEAKEEWGICLLGDILETVESGGRPKGGIDPNLKTGIASIGAENIDGIGKYDFSKTKFITQDFYDQMKRGKIKDYDVLIYKDGAYIGKKGMFALGYPFTECAINEHVFILRANKKATQSFLYFLLQKDEIEALNSNAAQPGINQEALKSLEIILPAKKEIDKFDTIILPWINKIFANAIQIRTLENFRDSLLPKLMSGEVRVKY